MKTTKNDAEIALVRAENAQLHAEHDVDNAHRWCYAVHEQYKAAQQALVSARAALHEAEEALELAREEYDAA